MAFKTFTAGDVLTASDLNTYLMRQSIISCTSATRPASPTEGMTIFETDTDLMLVYNGSAWVSLAGYGAWEFFAPTIGGAGWAIGNGTTSGAYVRSGRIVYFRAVIGFGSTSTFGGGGLTISLPVTATADNYTLHGFAVDASASGYYYLPTISASSTTMKPQALQSSVGLIQEVISTKPFTWATSDQIYIHGFYEAAA